MNNLMRVGSAASILLVANAQDNYQFNLLGNQLGVHFQDQGHGDGSTTIKIYKESQSETFQDFNQRKVRDFLSKGTYEEVPQLFKLALGPLDFGSKYRSQTLQEEKHLVEDSNHPTVQEVYSVFDIDHPLEIEWKNFASLSWKTMVAQPILYISVITMTFMIPVDFLWFFFQWVAGAVGYDDMIIRQVNDLISLSSGFWLIATENSLANIFILLPLDILWACGQFFWWLGEVIIIELDYIITGLILLHDRLYVIAIYIILDNWVFQTDVSDNLWLYFQVCIGWPFIIMYWMGQYAFGWEW